MNSITAFDGTITYSIYKAQIQLLTNIDQVTLVGNNDVLCPNLQLTVIHTDSSSPDATVFSDGFILGTDDFEFTIFTDQISKIDTYNFYLQVNFAGYSFTNNKQFQIIIDDPCQTATLNFIPSAIIQSFNIGYGDQIVGSFAQSDVVST